MELGSDYDPHMQTKAPPTVEPFMPQQVDDVSCGPYAWSIAKELTLYIIECAEDGYELGELQLTREFRRECRWNPVAIRKTIRSLMSHLKTDFPQREVERLLLRAKYPPRGTD